MPAEPQSLAPSTSRPSGLVLVTGADGFVGSAVCEALRTAGMAHRAVVRRPAAGCVAVGNIGSGTDWSSALQDCAVVLHLANRAHVARAGDPAETQACLQTNVYGSVRLLEQAAACGVRRLVYVSSAGVYGRARADICGPTTSPMPDNVYAYSKLAAERALQRAAVSAGIELVIVRPPLVYGPGVKANFLALARAVARGWPLPFASIENRRSLVSVRNLASFLVACLSHPDAPGEPLLVSDGLDRSTPELIRALARAMARSPRLFPVPAGVLERLARLLRRRHVAQSLLGSLVLDTTDSMARLGWAPLQHPVDEFDAMVRALVAVGAVRP